MVSDERYAPAAEKMTCPFAIQSMPACPRESEQAYGTSKLGSVAMLEVDSRVTPDRDLSSGG